MSKDNENKRIPGREFKKTHIGRPTTDPKTISSTGTLHGRPVVSADIATVNKKIDAITSDSANNDSQLPVPGEQSQHPGLFKEIDESEALDKQNPILRHKQQLKLVNDSLTNNKFPDIVSKMLSGEYQNEKQIPHALFLFGFLHYKYTKDTTFFFELSRQQAEYTNALWNKEYIDSIQAKQQIIQILHEAVKNYQNPPEDLTKVSYLNN